MGESGKGKGAYGGAGRGGLGKEGDRKSRDNFGGGATDDKRDTDAEVERGPGRRRWWPGWKGRESERERERKTYCVVYYESIKRELNKRLIFECRCDARDIE